MGLNKKSQTQEFAEFVFLKMGEFESLVERKADVKEKHLKLNEIGNNLLKSIKNSSKYDLQTMENPNDDDGFIVFSGVTDDGLALAVVYIYCNQYNAVDGIRLITRMNNGIRSLLITADEGGNYVETLQKLPNGVRDCVESLTHIRVKNMSEIR